MKKPSFAMYLLLLPGLLLISSCQTNNISVNKSALDKVKTVAVLEFDLAPGIDKTAASDAQEAFQSAFMEAGMVVLERQKILEVMKEKELSGSMDTGKNAQEIGQVLGADAVLFGKITQNQASKVTVTDEESGKSYETDSYDFQVQIHLTDTSKATVLLSMKNLLTNHKNDPKFLPIPNLETFRSYVLQGMKEDLVKTLKRK